MATVQVPEILLPDCADMTAWAVNACDQFTSDAQYWKNVEKICGDKPSAYNLIFPEIYLKDKPEERTRRINSNMRSYLSGNVFKSFKGFVYVERTTASGTRKGIVLAIDLEDYSFEKGAKTLVRSTEATILERIPPRIAIRRNAPLELPHAMLLYDDVDFSVLNGVERGKILYDFELMLGGGHVKGWLVSNSGEVAEAFGRTVKDGLLFAVGDGNHSLATAKAHWEEVKATLSEEERKNHPARFALAEAVNIYDGAINFEPIHRLIKTDLAEKLISGLKTSGGNRAYTVINGVKSQIPFAGDIPSGIRELDAYISEFIREYGGEVDYIHGEKELCGFTLNGGAGIILPPVKKSEFFNLIRTGGNLPKKTFSMGAGEEKRYYIEAKLIKQVLCQ